MTVTQLSQAWVWSVSVSTGSVSIGDVSIGAVSVGAVSAGATAVVSSSEGVAVSSEMIASVVSAESVAVVSGAGGSFSLSHPTNHMTLHTSNSTAMQINACFLTRFMVTSRIIINIQDNYSTNDLYFCEQTYINR